MSSRLRLDRRSFLGFAAGAAGATALGPWAADARPGSGHERHGGRLVPRDRLGLQQWSLRDATARLDRSVSGYLGGRDFPEDPTDLGPLVPLPGGFPAVFDYLGSVGYRGFEFFQFNQGPNGPITNEQLRTALRNAGMVAAGTHTGGLQQMVDPAYRESQIAMARTLGYRMIGTAGNPANPTSPLLADWQRYAEQANTVGAALREVGIKYFFHPEQDWFRFFADPAHPELSRVHRTPSTGACSTSTPGTAASPNSAGSSPGTSRTPTASSRSRRPGRTRSRRLATGRASPSTAASTSSTSARARSVRATRSIRTRR
jgi:hypothetical protein